MHVVRTIRTGLMAAIIWATAGAPAATITWTGGGDGVSLFQEANWDAAGGTLSGDYIPKGPATTPHDLVINIASNVGGTNGWGGTLDLAGVGSLTVSTATFRMSSTAVLKNGSASVTGSNFGYIRGTLDNANFSSNWGLNLSGPMHLINASTLEATWFAGGNGVSSLNGGSTLTIREDAAGTFNSNTIDFLDVNSTIVYSNTGRTVAEVVSEHLSSFRVNGAAAALNTNIYVDKPSATGYTTVRRNPQITWTGTNGNGFFFQNGNWEIDDVVKSGVPIDNRDLVIDVAGQPGYIIGGGGGIGGTLDLNNNSTLTVNGDADSFRMNTGGSFVIKNGTAYFKAGTGDFDFEGTWENLAVTIGSGGIDLPTGTLALTNGTTVDTAWCAGNTTTLDNASVLSVRDNGSVFAWGTIDLLDLESKVVFTGGKSVADVISEHLSGDVADTSTTAAGRILVNGQGAAHETNVYVYTDSVTGHTTVQAIAGMSVSGKLLDDPTWSSADPIGVGDGGIQNLWHWDSPGIQWETTSANTGTVVDHFDAGPVTLSSRPEISGHPRYHPRGTRLTGIRTEWEAADFAYAATSSYDPGHVIEGWYTIVIQTASGTYTGTSGTGHIHDGPTRLPGGNNGQLQANLATAWNTLSWDVDPFTGSGLVFADIASIDIDFYANTTASNAGASFSSWFTMTDSGLSYSVDIVGATGAVFFLR